MSWRFSVRTYTSTFKALALWGGKGRYKIVLVIYKVVSGSLLLLLARAYQSLLLRFSQYVLLCLVKSIVSNTYRFVVLR